MRLRGSDSHVCVLAGLSAFSFELMNVMIPRESRDPVLPHPPTRLTMPMQCVLCCILVSFLCSSQRNYGLITLTVISPEHLGKTKSFNVSALPNCLHARLQGDSVNVGAHDRPGDVHTSRSNSLEKFILEVMVKKTRCFCRQSSSRELTLRPRRFEIHTNVNVIHAVWFIRVGL